MKKITLFFTFLAVSFGYSQTDECAGATPVFCDDVVSGTTVGFTNSGGNSNAAVDVWYSYTGSGVPEDVTLDLCGSGYDTTIRVYTDCSVTGGSQILFNDDSTSCTSGTRSYGTFSSDGTTTYYIMIEGYASSSGAYQMAVTCTANIPAPSNDLCANAEALALDTPTPGTTAGATDSSTGAADDSVCEGFTFKSDVWYTFVAPAEGAVLVNTTITGSSTEASVAVYSSTDCSQLDADSIVCSAGNGGESINATGLIGGNTYYIRVWSDGIAARTEGTFIIELVGPAPASNCAEEPITPIDGANDVPSYDLFDLSWTAPSSGPAPTSYNIYVGTMSDGSDQALFDNTVDTFYNDIFVGAENVTLYWSVRPLNGITEATGCPLWSFTTGAAPVPANDNLCNATPLTIDTTPAGNAYFDVGATAEAGEVVGSCFNGGINGSVWFTFVAPTSGEVEISTDIAGGTHADTEIAVYAAPSNCADASTLGAELACNQDIDGVNFLSIVQVTGLTPATTYYIQVDRWGTQDPGYFGISVFDLETLSTEDLQIDNNAFTYFPNPVTNSLTLKAKNNIESISVYNMLGQQVLHSTPKTVENSLDMSALQSGAYFVKVTIGSTTETIRIIKN